MLGELWCRHDDGLPALGTAVSDGRSLARPRGLSSGVEQRLNGLEEPTTIALDGQHVVAFGRGWPALCRVAMQGVGGDKNAVQIEQGKSFESTGNRVAWSLPLSQRHAGAC